MDRIALWCLIKLSMNPPCLKLMNPHYINLGQWTVPTFFSPIPFLSVGIIRCLKFPVIYVFPNLAGSLFPCLAQKKFYLIYGFFFDFWNLIIDDLSSLFPMCMQYTHADSYTFHVALELILPISLSYSKINIYHAYISSMPHTSILELEACHSTDKILTQKVNYIINRLYYDKNKWHAFVVVTF